MKRNYLIPYERVPYPGRAGVMCNHPKYLKELGMHFCVHPMRRGVPGGAEGKSVLLVVEGTAEQFAALDKNVDVQRLGSAIKSIVHDG